VENPEADELDPADDVRGRCKKNSPSVLSWELHFVRMKIDSRKNAEKAHGIKCNYF